MKRTPLKSKWKAKPQVSAATRQIAQHRTGGCCACGCGRIGTEVHHIFPRQKYAYLIDDPDNVVWVARSCHANHEAASHRFPRKICRHAERLALTTAMRDYLENVYVG
jgi:hypothetical protein